MKTPMQMYEIDGETCVSRQMAAALLGLDPSAVNRLGWPRRGKDGRDALYRLADLQAEMGRRFAARHVVGADGEDIDVDLERARLIKAQRAAQEIKNAEALGERAPIADMVVILRREMGAAAALEALPMRLKRALPSTFTSRAVEVVEAEIAALRNEIADAKLDFSDR